MDSKVMISGDGGAPPREPISVRRMVLPAIVSLGIYFSSLRIDHDLTEHPLFVPLLFFLWAEVVITLGLVSFAVAGPRVHCEDQLAVKRAEEIAMRIANGLLFFVFALWIAIVVSIRFSVL